MVRIIECHDNISRLFVGSRKPFTFNGVAKSTFVEAIAVGVASRHKVDLTSF